MSFTQRKRTALQPQKELYLSTFLIALLTAATFFVPYMILSEGYFTFFGDFNVQQIPFYQTCHLAIRSGNAAWSWLTDLGANFVGSYSFYLLGSPFFWLTIPFPNAWVPYLMGPLLILKFACAALTAYCYLRRFTRTSEAARLGALLYAFCGFSVYNIFFNHFHEAIILFPVLLLTLEQLLVDNRRGAFAVAVALCAVSNYFFFFGMVVFCIIYFFVRLSTGALRVRFSRFLVLILEAVLGVLLAAVLLVPSILAILGNDRVSSILLGWNGIMYGKEQIYLYILQSFFFPPDLPARPVFFPSADVKWSSVAGWLPVFSTVGMFVLFRSKKRNWMRRLLGICLFMALVPILNSAFYAFNTAYYARWFYMPILILCLATVTLAEERGLDWMPDWKWVFGITAAFSALILLFPQKDADGKLHLGLYTQATENSEMYLVRCALTCLIAIVGLLILLVLLRVRRQNLRRFFRTAAVCVCAVSVIYGNVFVFLGRTHSYEIKDVMIDQLIEGEVDLNDYTDFRVDVFDGVDNTGMYLGLPCINAFHSVVPGSVMEFYKYVGEDRDVASRPSVQNPALRPLLSVKYLLNRSDGDSFVNTDSGNTEMPGYTYVKTSGGYYVYRNENYIPYGFSYDYYMTREFCESYSDTSRARLMLKAVLLEDDQVEKYKGMLTDLESVMSNGLYADPDDPATADIPSLSLSDDEMEADAARLAKTSAVNFRTANGSFHATVQRSRENLVFFSVPYDKGWSATVNGKPAEIERVNVGFMAVKVPAGESRIVFTYHTPGLTEGLLISGGALVIFLCYLVIASLVRKQTEDKTVYPEGEELLRAWHEDELIDSLLELQEQEEEESDGAEETPADPSAPEPEPEQATGQEFPGGFRVILDPKEPPEQ